MSVEFFEPRPKGNSFLRELITHKYLYLMAMPGLLFFLVFGYLPLVGLVIAFQDFNPFLGLFHSRFIGLKNFEFFFSSPDWLHVTLNTLYLNTIFIVSGIIAAITIAILLSEIKPKRFIKLTQSVLILPHFLSWTVVAMFAVGLFASDIGFINHLLKTLGLPTVDFFKNAGVWPLILSLLRLWHGAGFGSIVYLAAITGIDPEIYEAAKIDGAGRLQSIFYITLPMLKTTIILLTLFSVGRIFYGDFGMIYAIIGDNGLLFPTTDVIDTYVYRALRQYGDLGMASAAGFYQSLVGFILVIVFNYCAKKIDPDSAIF